MIADLHSDLLLDIAERRFSGERDVFRRLHLPALAAAGVRVQVLAVYAPTAYLPDLALRHALRLIDAAHREQDESNGALRIVTTAGELDAALSGGAIAGILSLEGAEPLGREPDLVHLFARLGIRSIGLTWNRANDFADGATEDRGAGITPLGRHLLGEMAAAGVALDVSHLTPRGAHNGIEHAPGPVFASHSNAAAVYGTLRNLDDEILRGIAGRDGVVGINLLPVFLGPGEVGPAAAAHHAHLAAIDPTLPAVGADLVGFFDSMGPPEPQHLRPPQGSDSTLAGAAEPPRETAYAAIRDAVTAASGGHAADAVLEANAMRFLRTVLTA